jgi:hypothetical protein
VYNCVVLNSVYLLESTIGLYFLCIARHLWIMIWVLRIYISGYADTRCGSRDRCIHLLGSTNNLKSALRYSLQQLNAEIKKSNQKHSRRERDTIHDNSPVRVVTLATSHLSLDCFQVRRLPLTLLTPELNPSAQRYLTRFFTGDFASWTVHFVNIRVKNQQIHQLFIQFINYVW